MWKIPTPKGFSKQICQFFIPEYYSLFSFSLFFWKKSYFLYFCTKFWLVSKLFLEYFERRKWGGGHWKKKKVLVTKMEKIRFLYNEHFVYTFTRTRLIGTLVYATENIPENNKICWHLLKTDIKSSSNLVWLFILTSEVTTKMAKKKSANFLDNFLGG